VPKAITQTPPHSPPTRRLALQLIGALPLYAGAARAMDGQWAPLTADDGAPLQNFRIPVELDPARAPGVLWKGAQSASIVLYEFFDYNCAYCRKAAREIDAIVASDADLRLGLVNNPILGLGSVLAAKVQQAILRLHGPNVAFDFHQRLFAHRGGADGVAALAIARAMKLDVSKIEESADSDTVRDVLSRQEKLAANLGLQMTPAFVVAGYGLLGWPGSKSTRGIIDSVKRCGEPHCGKN
jgi:hypothetical protein